MRRFLVFASLFAILLSCSKKNEIKPIPQAAIPDNINGTVYEFNIMPLDITTPDKAYMLVQMNNTMYKVAFNATDSAHANALLHFATDSILTNDSREIANVGRDAVTYFPVKANAVEIRFADGRKVFGYFDSAVTTFSGTFGERVITQWRESDDPAKPNEKARGDIQNLIDRYFDKDGPGPETTPIYLLVTVSNP